MLAAVAAACAFLLATSDANADETDRAVSTVEKAPAIQIVPGVPQGSEAVNVVIAPAGQAAEESDAPILVAPYEEKQSGKAKAAKKPAKKAEKKPAKTKTDTKKKEATRAKSAAKKPAAAPMAKETASEKARAEWQKKRSSENATPKKVKVASDKANGPSTAGGRAPSKASSPAVSKTGHRVSASYRKDSRTYREIYNSIPFSRAEYDANPGYRHLATMEIMLGQLHPIIVAPPAPPCRESKREINIRFLPAIRPGYRAYSQYPWH
jgi:flagellar biosynthesis GTPase FlhF